MSSGRMTSDGLTVIVYFQILALCYGGLPHLEVATFPVLALFPCMRLLVNCVNLVSSSSHSCISVFVLAYVQSLWYIS
jgi:hypothetical protein